MHIFISLPTQCVDLIFSIKRGERGLGSAVWKSHTPLCKYPQASHRQPWEGCTHCGRGWGGVFPRLSCLSGSFWVSSCCWEVLTQGGLSLAACVLAGPWAPPTKAHKVESESSCLTEPPRAVAVAARVVAAFMWLVQGPAGMWHLSF